MERISLSKAAYAFYQAGECSGSASTLEQLAKDVRNMVSNCQKQKERSPDVIQLLQDLNRIATHLEAERDTKRQLYGQLITGALQISAPGVSLYEKVRRTVAGAKKGWEGR